jgi:hypothetical protein
VQAKTVHALDREATVIGKEALDKDKAVGWNYMTR